MLAVATALVALPVVDGPAGIPSRVELAERFEVRDTEVIRFYYPEGIELPRLWLEKLAESALDDLSRSMGVVPAKRLHLVVAASAESFQWVTGGAAPEWGAGVAFPMRGLVVLRFDGADREREELERVLRHEFAHVLLGGWRVRVPRWFDEGHAMLRSQLVTPEMILALARASWRNRLLSLSSLRRDFPESEGLARLAYAESYDAVRYIEEAWSPEALQWILLDLSRGTEFEEALVRNLGVSSTVYGIIWRREARGRYGWLDLVGDGTFAWGIMSLAFVAAAFLSVIRRRRRLEAMEDDPELDEGFADGAHCPTCGRPHLPPLPGGRGPEG